MHIAARIVAIVVAALALTSCAAPAASTVSPAEVSGDKDDGSSVVAPAEATSYQDGEALNRASELSCPDTTEVFDDPHFASQVFSCATSTNAPYYWAMIFNDEGAIQAQLDDRIGNKQEVGHAGESHWLQGPNWVIDLFDSYEDVSGVDVLTTYKELQSILGGEIVNY